MEATIGVGMLGYSPFMGRAHVAAFRAAAELEPPLVPLLVAIAGRTESAVAEAAQAYGFEQHVMDWRELVADERVGLFDNGGPNDVHAEPTIAAVEAGKHVLCEKPLGRTADEAYGIWSAAERAGVVHMCGFNNRFVPAIRLARELVEAGDLGELRHARFRYLQDRGDDPAIADAWRFDPETAGSGAAGDIGSHAIDLARYLAGEVAAVSAAVRTFAPERGVDDAFASTLELEGGVLGTLEASRFATGRRNALSFELNGSKGSVAFDNARPNELEVHRAGHGEGFGRLVAAEAAHAYTHEILHLLRAIAGEDNVAPHGATFEDGYRAAEVCDAILRSAETGRRVALEYRGSSVRA